MSLFNIMRAHFVSTIFLLLLISFIGCKDSHPTAVEPPQKTPHHPIDQQPFSVEPISGNQFQINVSSDTYQRGRVYLMRGSDTLSSESLTSSDTSQLQGTLKYSFDDNPYDLAFDLQKGTVDTLYSYHINEYSFHYLKGLKTKQLASFSGNLGSYDLTPDERFIYWSEHSQDNGNFTFTLNRLDRRSGKQELVDDKFDGWQLVRARSKDEIISYTKKFKDLRLRQDSAALISYDPKTQAKTFLEYVSDGYGRFSHIVDDHIIVTRPYLSKPSAYVINLADHSHEGLDVDFRYIDEYVRNLLKVESYRFNLTEKSLQPINPILPDSDSVINFAPDDGTIVASRLHYIDRSTLDYRVGLAVYRGAQEVFEEPRLQKKSIYWAVYQPDQQQVLFYQKFVPDTNPKPNGLYKLDLNSDSIQLVDNLSTQFNRVIRTKDGELLGINNAGIFNIQI